MAVSPGGRRADDSPLGAGNNWVTKAGGLPKYIREVAHALLATHSESDAIAIAVQKMRDWAAGGDNVRPQVQAAAAKAIAEWETLKAKARADLSNPVDLAGAFNPALHPRAGGKFAPKGTAVQPTGGATETQLPPAVQQQLAAWQAAEGLPVTGQYDSATMRSLMAAAGGKGSKAKVAKLSGAAKKADAAAIIGRKLSAPSASAATRAAAGNAKTASQQKALATANRSTAKAKTAAATKATKTQATAQAKAARTAATANAKNARLTAAATKAAQKTGAAQALQAAKIRALGLTQERTMDPIDLAAPTTAQRKHYAKTGVALPDGSFPIPNKAYLKKAILAVGRAKNPAAAKAHIVKRANALGVGGTVPSTWSAANDNASTALDLARKPVLPRHAAKLRGFAQAHRTRAARLMKAGDKVGATRALAKAKQLEALTAAKPAFTGAAAPFTKKASAK